MTMFEPHAWHYEGGMRMLISEVKMSSKAKGY